jgi:putative FmdB family regulatory protein
MPTYDYECTSCGKVFEVFQQMSEKPVKECPDCGKEVKRLVGGGIGIIFKGSGFYVTDSKKKSSSSSSSESSAPKEKTAASTPESGGKSSSAEPVASKK